MRHFLFLGFCASAAALCSRATAADEVHLAPQPGVLLLNHGELIEGTITDAGDRYDVDLTDGQIYIKRSDVAKVCRNAHECYLHKRAGIEVGRAQDHLDLAEWCLRNALVDDAEKELADGRAADPRHPKIRLLEPRLGLAKQAPGDPETASIAEKTVSLEQLDGIVRNLPAGSMENFTNAIQPMLLNYCARSGCHGPRSTNALRLERIGSNRLSGRHPTQRNLQAALALVDRDKPQDSKLLQAPIRPHGTMKLPVFTDREQSQYKQLVQWVYALAARDSSARPTLDERAAPLLQTIPRRGQAPAIGPADAPPLDAAQPDAAPAPAQGATQHDSQDRAESLRDAAGLIGSDRAGASGGFRVTRVRGQVVLRPLARPGEAAKEFTPKDPFDPEIFNRRFFGQ